MGHRPRPDQGVFVCRHVAEGSAPILRVSNDGEGDWQFLCGGSHGEGSGERPLLLHFAHVLERDPSLGGIEVCAGDSLVRGSPAQAWRIEEDFEARTRRHIVQFGWSVVQIAAYGSAPAFAYTLGLWETLAHPELILIGLRRDTAHAVLNDCGGRIRQGEKLRAGMVDREVLRGYPVVYVDMRPEHVPTWTGAALRHYRAKGIPHFLQIVWPDRDGRFPWDRGAPADFREAQPVLGTPPNQ